LSIAVGESRHLSADYDASCRLGIARPGGIAFGVEMHRRARMYLHAK
jgi:hypothetical protein